MWKECFVIWCVSPPDSANPIGINYICYSGLVQSNRIIGNTCAPLIIIKLLSMLFCFSVSGNFVFPFVLESTHSMAFPCFIDWKVEIFGLNCVAKPLYMVNLVFFLEFSVKHLSCLVQHTHPPNTMNLTLYSMAYSGIEMVCLERIKSFHAPQILDFQNSIIFKWHAFDHLVRNE